MNYVLDTNVLLHDPEAIFSFGNNDVYIPIYVFDELDKFKKELSQRGKSAREVIRKVEALRQVSSLFVGVSLGEGKGKLHVKYAKTETLEIPFEDELRLLDNAILATAKHIAEITDGETRFVTMDVNLRLRADAMGIKVEDYKGESPRKIEELYTGIMEITVKGEVIDSLYNETVIPRHDDWDLYPNQFVILKTDDASGQSGMGRFIATDNTIRLVSHMKNRKWSGISARNKEQSFAFDILLDPAVTLITLVGKAGTGKTLLAIAAGLTALEEDDYKALVVSRPIFPMGRDLGFLPGDVDAKLNPWMQPIFDNMELIAQLKNGLGATYKDIVEGSNIRIEPLTYIRGRSLPNQFMIVDEAQNLTPHEVKTIITRCGDGTKIILTGDPYQIDNPYVDATNNGLTYVVERFKGQNLSGHITLARGERSGLAELASNLL
ncbi:PhoH family protein [Myxococcota bacterium]|nr:PhoH family protein [Myxococcota bacterium]MBU1536548.1 PhoH family protein [Myxococcota bacterium]